MLFGKARPKLLLFGDFSLISVFCYRICALRLSQEDGCVEKNEEESLIPLISVMPFQHESPQTLPASVHRRHTASLHRLGHIRFPSTTHCSPGQQLERCMLPFSGWPGALTSRSSQPCLPGRPQICALNILIHAGGLGGRAAVCRHGCH